MKLALSMPVACAVALAAAPAATGPLPGLKVSENRHFLVYEDGRPFFYLGDTAWELFHRLTREEASFYLEDRAHKGFTVIQAVALAEFDGLSAPNAYGHCPLRENDPARPAVRDGPANDYWDHVDFVVDVANSLGLYVGLLPTWGDKWNRKWGKGPEIFTPENAAAYGEWLGRRYRDRGIIWILGGDRPVETEAQREILRAMASGLRKGDGGTHLVTLHPSGGESSSAYFRGEEWLDFDMRQNGHATEFTGHYDRTRADYDRTPPRPVIDGEPIYEGHPVSFKAEELGYSIAADVRRPLYWDLFSGACGHTYGHHSVWQFWAPGREPVNGPLLPWVEALDAPGAHQMQHARRLLESRPILTRIPDDTVVVTDRVPASVPGAGRYRFAAARDAEGRYAMVYAPVGRPFKVRMAAVKGPLVRAWWFDPRDGKATPIGAFAADGEQAFTPPDPGEPLDWVLVLDDAAQGYPPPGQVARR
ncbi:MAG TPA: glycoside hydrolase family 140 protein [Vicinamibacteria bacterium]|nr:glycoside hydrolase family 140 protein [Vicinamibacteria bacterium]